MFDNVTHEQIIEFLSSNALSIAQNIIFALLIVFVGRFAVRAVVHLLETMLKRTKQDNMLIDFVKSVSRSLLMLVVLIAALSQLGVDTTSLVALIGAAGLAIGLSLQDSLKNFASGILLLVFKPFKVGNYIDAAGISGTVHRIGIFTTTLTTIDNKVIIVPNSNIYQDSIINYSAMEHRRIDMVFGIGYESDLKQAKAILQRLVDQEPRILAEPEPIVAVAELADSSVNFVVRPWVKRADYFPVLWNFTEQVKLAFDEEGITIPYPQMYIHLANEQQSDK